MPGALRRALARFGLELAAGATPAEALHSIGQVVEGYIGARAVHRVAEKHKVPMPIVVELNKVLHEGADPRAAVAALMRRPISPELG